MLNKVEYLCIPNLPIKFAKEEEVINFIEKTANVGEVIQCQIKKNKKGQKYNAVMFVVFYQHEVGISKYEQLMKHRQIKLTINEGKYKFLNLCLYKSRDNLNALNKTVIKLEIENTMLWNNIIDLRRINGIMCCSCNETDHLYPDKEFPEKFYCRSCYRKRMFELALIEKNNKIYDHQREINIIWKSGKEDKNLLIEEHIQEISEINDEIKILLSQS